MSEFIISKDLRKNAIKDGFMLHKVVILLGMYLYLWPRWFIYESQKYVKMWLSLFLEPWNAVFTIFLADSLFMGHLGVGTFKIIWG